MRSKEGGFTSRSSPSATLTGLGAVALWAGLALVTAASGPVPPFQMTAMTFLIGGSLGAATWIVRPAAVAALRQPPTVWALGIGGLFGYHALYFAALRWAPPAEASLVNYLWPLLIVLFSAMLPGEALRPRHLAGALLGLAGVATLLIGSGGLAASSAAAPGYACALAAALVWSTYSVLSRRFGEVSTDAVTGFCLATAALSAICHLTFEQSVWPSGASQWAALVLAGLGPLGAAFYLWDIGVKHGDIRLLGVASYAIPIASTLILVLAGYAEPSTSLWLACALIAAAALVARGRGVRARPDGCSDKPA